MTSYSNSSDPITFQYHPSLNCFFNALLREWQGWQYRAYSDGPLPEQLSETRSTSGNERLWPTGWFEIPTTQGSVFIPCMTFSTTGRHHLLSPCFSKTQDVQALSFSDAVTEVMHHSPICHALTPQTSTDQELTDNQDITEKSSETLNNFIARALQSDANLQQALTHRDAELNQLFGQALNFSQAESALFTGHSIHPCPKARDNFSEDDTLAYAPEFGGQFQLAWYKINTAHLYTRATEGFDYASLIQDLIANDSTAQAWQQQLEEGFVLYPCHPFQHKVWQTTPRLVALMEAGDLVHLGSGSIDWSATTSVRAIYSKLSPWMLKFSLNVKLTNSIRHLQPEELVRGAELCRVLKTPPAQAFEQRFSDRFNILFEPTAAAVCDEHGKPFEETIVLWRENPFIEGHDHNTEVLATLLQDDPRSGQSRLEQSLKQWQQSSNSQQGSNTRHDKSYASLASEWFKRYLDVAVKPLLIAQADYGLLFGAHQQNIVLRLSQGMPVHMYFRDCQGTGFSQLANQLYTQYLPDMAADSANVVEDEMAIRLFSYYLIINATFNVISSLSRSGEVPESVLIGQLQFFLNDIKAQGVRDAQCIDYLLNANELSAKGNFFVSLKQLNENTETDYLAMYHPMANPLKLNSREFNSHRVDPLTNTQESEGSQSADATTGSEQHLTNTEQLATDEMA